MGQATECTPELVWTLYKFKEALSVAWNRIPTLTLATALTDLSCLQQYNLFYENVKNIDGVLIAYLITWL
jgi:hypothetical protein